MMIWIKPYLILLLVPFSFHFQQSGNDNSNLPEEDILLRIERSRDPDEVWYTTNTDARGKIFKQEPVKVFWVRKSNQNAIEPLTNLQERIGYGIRDLVQVSEEVWNFRLAGYKEYTFILERSVLKDFHLAVLYEGKKIKVEKLYISFNESGFFAPVVAYVEMFGVVINTGEEFSAIIKENN